MLDLLVVVLNFSFFILLVAVSEVMQQGYGLEIFDITLNIPPFILVYVLISSTTLSLLLCDAHILQRGSLCHAVRSNNNVTD